MLIFDPIFPGMDPFIEDQFWGDFQSLLISQLRWYLTKLLRPRYLVLSESNTHLYIRPDISVFRGKPDTEPLEISPVAIAEANLIMTPTIYEVEEQPFIQIRDEEGRLVTVIEVLSPSNKTVHRERYLAKRDRILYGDIHLIELDLLRGGKRTEAKFPKEGYVLMVARAQPDAPHRAEVYQVGLRDPLPAIPVPLVKGDPDIPLDISKVVGDVYIAASYRLHLDYTRMPLTPFSPEDEAWVKTLLANL